MNKALGLMVGAYLHQARESAWMLPDQAADHLPIRTEQVNEWEAGEALPTPRQLSALLELYKQPGQYRPLVRLLGQGRNSVTPSRSQYVDREPGHAERLAKVSQLAESTRWLSTITLHESVATPDYTTSLLRMHTHPDSPRQPTHQPRTPSCCDTFIIAAGALQHPATPRHIMGKQVRHLINLMHRKTVIRICPGDRSVPKVPGHLGELRLPAGHLLVRQNERGVAYQHTTGLSARLDRALAETSAEESTALLAKIDQAHRQTHTGKQT
ncbi:Scr1 family TA system antitoxin-like transcriptional regulator [Streptomyces sp. NPDC002917]|uniref:Scr1 family TA system antitoxin-like transcriptional regulator n=1 Tax=Streptomyces sp. NPDC002917 TaxID=3364671 RepID=UPI0036773878